ncbi:MAG: P-type conjugative transfer protein TrbG [Pseudonocardiaceae bacterium]
MKIKTMLTASAALSFISTIAAAQSAVPALDMSGGPMPPAAGSSAAAAAAAAPPSSAPAQPQYPSYAPPAIAVIQGANPRLTARERAGVDIAQTWAGSTAKPATGTEGAAIFTFGETLPSIVCAPLFVCDVTLQAGEVINDINLGDSTRWKISPASSGVGASAVTHVLIKPTDAGLTTNLLITTDRRTYILKLVSHRTEWMPRVAFSYPEEVQQEWNNFLAAQRAAQARVAIQEMAQREATVLPTGEPLDQLDFGFSITGANRAAWRPLRVYTDGSKTYIQFPGALLNEAAPVLVGVGEGNSTEILNYRVMDDRYVVDQVLTHAALISGVGREQARVDIRREKGR